MDQTENRQSLHLLKMSEELNELKKKIITSWKEEPKISFEEYKEKKIEEFKKEKFSDETNPEDENERDDIKLLEKDE